MVQITIEKLTTCDISLIDIQPKQEKNKKSFVGKQYYVHKLNK